MSDDEVIRQNVLEDLRWSPRVNATHICVAVRNGVVELTGHWRSGGTLRPDDRFDPGLASVSPLAIARYL